jgi:uncharacterized membrane protein (UPF0182 family)
MRIKIRKNKKSLIKYLIYAVFLVVLFVLPGLVRLYTDWLWFEGVGFTKIFSTIIGTKLFLGLAAGSFAAVFMYANLRLATKFTKDRPINVTLLEKLSIPVGMTTVANRLILPASLIFGFFAGQAASAQWLTLLTYLNSTPFNLKDPLFGQDIGFYFFTLPFLNALLAFAWWIVLPSLVLTISFYFLKTALWVDQSGIIIDKNARKHVFTFGALIFLLFALGNILSRFNLLTSPHSLGTGAYFATVNAVLPVLMVLAGLALVCSGTFLLNLFRNSKKLILLSVGAYFLIWLVGLTLYPTILQKLVVGPNELVKEAPFIKHNIAATRTAFDLDDVEERKLTGETTLSLKDIKNNDATIKNVRLWDRKPLLDSFGQVQEIRTYYDFVSVDNDRYSIDGELRQIMLSPRELNVDNLPNKTFINERLTFTHGFGLAAGPVNQVTAEGLPVLFTKNIPPASSTKVLDVKRPEIYFGELSSDYVFVQTKADEFNYPKGDENVFQTYEGKAGVKIDSLAKKALFAARFGSLRVLLSDDITGESKVLFYRNISERVAKIAPFLHFDSDPYLVVSKKGRLVWIYDAYATSDRFPYSQLVDGRLNYIRNSVKVTVDAYDGTMRFYVADSADPLIQTYQKIFPGAFLPISEMPIDLRKHIRYPEDIFAYQSVLYSIYHMDQPQIFYNKEDQWDIPLVETTREQSEEVTMMRHMIMKLPGQKKEEFILMLPFTPKGKRNLIAWMVARNDVEHYGKLVAYRFPKQKLIFGPKQVTARISQDAEISRQISLWDQRGSEVIRGALLVIPIEEALLYVQPLYLRGEGGKIPELKRVILAYENRIAMEETLEKALARVFGKGAPVEKKATEEQVQPDADLPSQAQAAYEAALKAQKEGDWAEYGEEIKRLGEILNKMQNQ